MKDKEKIGGPCRDRTYDQLIKSPRQRIAPSRSIGWGSALLFRLESGGLGVLAKARKARKVARLSMLEEQEFEKRDRLSDTAVETMLLAAQALLFALVMFAVYVLLGAP